MISLLFSDLAMFVLRSEKIYLYKTVLYVDNVYIYSNHDILNQTTSDEVSLEGKKTVSNNEHIHLPAEPVLFY